MMVEQWDDEWWRIWVEGRADKLDGEASAARADRVMSERHGARPDDPLPLGGVVPAGRLVFNGPDLAESVLRLARGANLELDPWQADAIKRLYGVVAAEREPRRGWLGRLLDRVFGGQA